MSGREYGCAEEYIGISPGVISILLYLCMVVCFSAEKVFAEELQHLTVIAEAGDCISQTALAEAYETGNGVPVDYQMAFHWYQKAAASGYANAQRALGVLYEMGRGIGKDAVKAAEWYRKAAEQGVARAQVNLGQLYEVGEGVERDYAQAVSWYRKAAATGYGRGETHLGLMYAHGRGVERDLAMARSLYAKAVAGGYPKAKSYLSRLERDDLLPEEKGHGNSKDKARQAVSLPKTSEEENSQGAKHFYLGNEYAKSGRYDLAITEFIQSLTLEPENVNTLENIAICQKKMGRLPDAIATMDKVLALKPNDPRDRMVLAIMLIDDGEYTQAIQQLKIGLTLNPTMAGLYNEMAVAYGSIGDYDRALKSALVAEALGYNDEELIADLRKAGPPGLKIDIQQAVADGYYLLRQLVVETREQAESCLNDLRNGKDFTALVEEKAAPQFRKNGGFFSFYRKGEIHGELRPEISNIIEKLPLFSFSPILTTEEGYRIFQKVAVFSDLLSPTEKEDKINHAN